MIPTRDLIVEGETTPLNVIRESGISTLFASQGIYDRVVFVSAIVR